MFCFYCGKKINDDEVFCPFCGKKIECVEDNDNFLEQEDLGSESGTGTETIPTDADGVDDIDGLFYNNHYVSWDEVETQQLNESEYNEPNTDEKSTQNEGKKRNIKPTTVVIIILSVAVAVGLGIGAYMLFANNDSEVDLESLIYGPQYYGYDGFGELDNELWMDEEKRDAFLGTIDDEQKRSAIKGFLLTVKYHADKTEKLSNGDIIIINAEYDKDMAKDLELQVTGRSFDVEVEGLEEGEDIAYMSGLYDEYADDFLFPGSDQRNITEDEVYDIVWNDEDNIQRGINEIYARHGLVFNDSYYSKLFGGFEWYTPVYSTKQFKNSWFNKYENANINLLSGFREKVNCSVCGKIIYKYRAITEEGQYYCDSCYDEYLNEQLQYNNGFEYDEYYDEYEEETY